MTNQNNLTKFTFTPQLLTRMLIGGVIGLAVVSLLLYATKNPDPAWGKFWMIRPLIVLPLAGATGGAVNYYIDSLTNHGTWKKIFGILLSFVIFIIGLWMGTVLGFAGTIWN
ncbi:potassium transporter KefB [Pedobacter frigiditerrae]|uniref:Potassium transporter KefB n=1 Tax=Pedobacter frigiditerrae TaxID=2530452 RepID=A0A4R0MUC5_9SPHI|nr:potassium transporter KefB [Pedobacter frigiditerrae]TCC90337.1 potassium transporter KefB [Pedobacter frigiditerrae]